jgi:subtilisin family serine protease
MLTGCDSVSRPDARSESAPDAGNTASDFDDANADSATGAGFSFDDDADPALAALSFVQDELLVRVLPGAPGADVAEAYSAAGARVRAEMPEIQITILAVNPEELFAAAEFLTNQPLFEGVQKSYLYSAEQVPNDREFGSQWHLPAVSAPRAWDVTTGSADVVIAVLDTGVAATHADLAPKLVNGWNLVENSGNTADGYGHGTFVAGVAAAATNNDIGVAGVSWRSPILPVRVTGADGLASTRHVAAGLIWAVNHGARLVNISFAPLAADRTVLGAAQYARSAGSLVFVSAGNDARTSAARDNANAIFVSATDELNLPATFSNRGPFVDLAAPGTNIVTTDRSGGYRRVSGTSFASPLAAGIAALVWSVRPELRPVTVEQILFQTSRDLGAAGRDDVFGMGLVDAAAAVDAAVATASDVDTVAPSVSVISPADNATASGILRVTAAASDADGVVDVVLYLDGRAFATDPIAPYQFAVATAALTPGTHTLSCVAGDASGNTATSPMVHFRVGGATADTAPPVVVFNFPVDGSAFSGTVAIQATVTDNVALSRAEWLIDGIVRQTNTLTGTRQTIGYTWDAGSAASGPHTVTVRATDTSGNRATALLNLVRR